MQGAALPTPKKLRENPTASLLGPSPLPREESIFNTTLPSASSESIHMPKEKPESYTESIATTEGLPCPVVQLQPDTKARACACLPTTSHAERSDDDSGIRGDQ